jgi:hypothetical protein
MEGRCAGLCGTMLFVQDWLLPVVGRTRGIPMFSCLWVFKSCTEQNLLYSTYCIRRVRCFDFSPIQFVNHVINFLRRGLERSYLQWEVPNDAAVGGDAYGRWWCWILPFLESLCIIIYSQYVCNRLLFRCGEGLDTAQFIFLLSKIKHSVTSCEYGCEKKLVHKHLELGNHMVWICAVCLDEPDVDKLPWDCFVSWVWNRWVYI